MKKLSVKNRLSVLKSISKGLLIATTFLLVACGSDDEANNAITADGKVDVSKGLVFKVNFADYNSTDTLQTRSAAKNDTLAKEVVELSNGLLAEVTIKKDTENLKHEATTTRALANDTYTMLAYRGGILRGELKGTVSGGVFTPAAGGPADMQLPVGYAYDFVLFNSSVTRNGNTLEVAQGSAATALIGRTTYTVTATPSLQEVSFNMEHSMARVKIKLIGYMDIKATTTATLTTDKSIAVYDILNNTWSAGSGATTLGGTLTFPASTEAKYYSTTYTTQSNEYEYFHGSTNPSDLKLKFTGGTIYNLNMAGAELKLSVPTLATMRANGSYVINVKLMYQFLYLMSDGTTGFFKQTTYGGGSKTPIGLVVSRSNRLAIALKEANNGLGTAWCPIPPYAYSEHNYRQFPSISDEILADMDGYKYTWGPAGSSDGTTIKATSKRDGTTYDFPAFYHAGNYNNELTASGITLSDGMENKKWHLPSVGEWKYAFTALGFGDGKMLAQNLDFPYCYVSLFSLGFTQVGGTSVENTLGYWSSTEYAHYSNAFILEIPSYYMILTIQDKRSDFCKVRPFIYY